MRYHRGNNIWPDERMNTTEAQPENIMPLSTLSGGEDMKILVDCPSLRTYTQSRCRWTSVRPRRCHHHMATYDRPTTPSPNTTVVGAASVACAPPVALSSVCSTCRRPPSCTPSTPTAVRRRRRTWCAWRRSTAWSPVATADGWNQTGCRRRSTRDALTPSSSSWHTVVVDALAASGSLTPVRRPSYLPRDA